MASPYWKKLSALLSGIASNHVGDFYCWNYFHSYRTEEKLEKNKDVCKNHDYCSIEMPEEDNKVLQYNHREKSMKYLLNISLNNHLVYEIYYLVWLRVFFLKREILL